MLTKHQLEQEYCARYMHPEDDLSLGEIRSEDKKTWEALKKAIGGAENGSSTDE